MGQVSMTSASALQKLSAAVPQRSVCRALFQCASSLAPSKLASTGAVLLVAVSVPPVMAEVPLPPPRPREQGSAPSPPPVPAQPAPAKPPTAAFPTDEECLTNLQKLGFDAEAVSTPPAPEPECVIDKRFCQGSRHRLWPTRVRLGIGPPLTKGAGEDAVLGMRVGSCDRAARAHRPGLSPVPLPRLWQAVQRAQRRCAEPDPVSLRCHRPRGALALALQTGPARPARDVRRARPRVQP